MDTYHSDFISEDICYAIYDALSMPIDISDNDKQALRQLAGQFEAALDGKYGQEVDFEFIINNQLVRSLKAAVKCLQEDGSMHGAFFDFVDHVTYIYGQEA